MDERLSQALEFSNYRQTLNNQLQKLKIRTEGLLIFAKSGGSFTVTRELICFLEFLKIRGISESVLLDDNNAPIKISNVSEFLDEVTQRYFEVTNDYLIEYQEIRKSRNVKAILAIEVEK